MSPLTGTLTMLRAEVRHDGRLVAPWIALTTLLSASSVVVYPWLFPDHADRAEFAAVIGGNPALGLVFGPAHDLLSDDGFNAWRSLAIGGFLTALGMIFAITRACRAQEDSGQAELLASAVMGRAARLTSAVTMCLVFSVALGLVTGLVTVAFGGGWNASMLLAATMAATGWMFTAVSAVTNQLGSDARTANTMAVGTLGVLFILRGFTYAVDAPSWTIWANPLGWMSKTEPAVANNWWPLLLAFALTAVLLAIAVFFQSQRDFGVGAIPPRPGPARGRIRSPWGLALSINRGPIITWIIAFAGLGLIFGNLTTSIPDILGSDTAIQQVLAAGATSTDTLVGAFLVTILSLVGIIACIAGVQTMLKVRAEEMEDRVEPILATAVSRPKYYASNVVFAFVFPAIYVLIAGTIIGALGSAADIGISFGDAVIQALATVPAVWTVVGLSILVIGARPKVSLAAWMGVLASFVLTLLGPSFKLWDWILGISPFWHIPNAAAASVDWSGLGWISLFTLAFVTIGFVGFRRRDLAR